MVKCQVLCYIYNTCHRHTHITYNTYVYVCFMLFIKYIKLTIYINKLFVFFLLYAFCLLFKAGFLCITVLAVLELTV